MLADLRSQCAWATMHSRPPSYSQPAYTVLFTGAWSDLNGGPIFNHVGGSIPAWTQDHLFALAGTAGFTPAISAYIWYEELLPTEDVQQAFFTHGDDRFADREVVDAALPWLESSEPSFILIHLDQVDYAGHHEGGPADPRWDQAAGRVDALLREIVSRLDLTQDTLVVCSDHGHIRGGGHGGNEPDVVTQPLLLTGAGIIPGDYGDVNMVDLAPTLSAIMGAPLPAISQGVVRSEMLDLPAETQEKLAEATRKQQARLLAAYAEAIGQPPPAIRLDGTDPEQIVSAYQAALEGLRKTRLQEEQLPLLALIILGWLAILLILLRQKSSRLMLVGGLFYFLLFVFFYRVIGSRTFSFSSIDSPEGFILSSAWFTAPALAGGIILVWIADSPSAKQPLRTALSILYCSLAGIFWLSLPVLLQYAVNGLGAGWYMPDFTWAFLGLLGLVQVLLVALIGLIYSGLAGLSLRFFKSAKSIR